MTLLETMACVAIIGVIAAATYPVFASAKASAKERRSVSDMRQIAIATQIYREDWKSAEFGTMEAMGLPGSYVTLNGPNAFKTHNYLRPPIYPPKYPYYYWMPLPRAKDGRIITWEEAALAHGERTVLVCDPWLHGFIGGVPVWYDPSRRNPVNGIDLGGSLIKKKDFGKPWDFSRWEY